MKKSIIGYLAVFAVSSFSSTCFGQSSEGVLLRSYGGVFQYKEQGAQSNKSTAPYFGLDLQYVLLNDQGSGFTLRAKGATFDTVSHTKYSDYAGSYSAMHYLDYTLGAARVLPLGGIQGEIGISYSKKLHEFTTRYGLNSTQLHESIVNLDIGASSIKRKGATYFEASLGLPLYNQYSKSGYSHSRRYAPSIALTLGYVLSNGLVIEISQEYHSVSRAASSEIVTGGATYFIELPKATISKTALGVGCAF